MLKGSPADLDYFALLKEARTLKPGAGEDGPAYAVFADCTSQQFTALFRVLMARQGARVRVVDTEFDSMDLELQNADSAYHRLGAQVTLILNTTQALRDRYGSPEASAGGFTETVTDEIVRRWEQIHRKNPSALVLQSNYVLPTERLYGNHDAKVPGAWRTSVEDINTRLTAAARERSYVHLIDADHTASMIGKRVWFDEKLWILSKSCCALECLPQLVQNYVDAAMSLRGAGVKCVVTDLDNTLWGGVVGDDGLEGIRIGHLDDGPAFTRYQQWLRRLKQRGILLAVCSRNDSEIALAPFKKHPDMVLREEDIAVFVANWNNKADNLRLIQKTLNIGFDSMVFVDDDAFERNLVRRELPEMIVPEIPSDPADLVGALTEMNLFETSAVSEEDAARTEKIRTEATRQDLRGTCRDIGEYLDSLEMRGRLERFDAFRLPRIAQLIQRSNQFNLTTRRYSEAECGEMMKDEARYLPFYLELRDRFGDSGLICVVVLEVNGDVIDIPAWLMSCRVLLRGVEDAAMNHVFEAARARGAARVRGVYRPTPKNRMVEKFYENFGFRPAGVDPDGAAHWELSVGDYRPRNVRIKLEPAEEGLREARR